MDIRLLLSILVLIALTACATGYKPRGFNGGYSHIELAEDTFQVRFQGNDMTSREQAEDFALLRAAELALSKGYRYFIIAHRTDQTSKDTLKLPVYSSGETTYKGDGKFGHESYTYGGDTTKVSPNYVYVVKALNNKPEDETLIVYDAETVEHSVRARYKLGADIIYHH